MEDKHEYECLICLDEVDDEYTYVKCHNCNKLFHEDCMLTWKYKQNKCNLKKWQKKTFLNI